MRDRLEDLDENQLFALYAEGHVQAFDLFYKKMSSKIWSFIKRRIVSTAKAEDIYQEVWSKIHRSREQYDAKFPVMPWIFTIARSVLYDNLRSVERNPETLIGDEALGRAVDHSSMVHDQEVKADQKQNEKLDESLKDRLLVLTEDQKQLVDLRYQQDLGFDEIADQLGLSEANVRQKISRLFKVLRRRIS